MKEIKSRKYAKIEKTSQVSLPGDPGLPPGVTERMISDSAGDGEDNSKYGQQGFAEIDVNWGEFADWYESAGDVFPLPNTGIDTVAIDFKYDYIENWGESDPQNIRVVSAKVYPSQQIADPNILAALGEYYMDDLTKAAKEAELNM